MHLTDRILLTSLMKSATSSSKIIHGGFGGRSKPSCPTMRRVFGNLTAWVIYSFGDS
jgi:hypothetical protein